VEKNGIRGWLEVPQTKFGNNDIFIIKKIMVQPNYNPQESLERVKLMMKYDTSKTLNENKEIIFEQDTTDADVGEIVRELDKFNTDEQKIVDIIKKYNNNSSFQNLLNKYKAVSGKDFGSDIARAIQPYNDKTEWNDLKTHLSTLGITLGSVVTNGRTSATFDGLSKTGGGKTGGGKTGGGKTGGGTFISCPETFPIKKSCKNETIKKVQACLGGLVVDGKFGDKTQKALESKGQDGTKITTETIIAVCGKSGEPAKDGTTPPANTPTDTAPATKPDEIEQVDADDSIDLLK
jgi:hypothetical protein